MMNAIREWFQRVTKEVTRYKICQHASGYYTAEVETFLFWKAINSNGDIANDGRSVACNDVCEAKRRIDAYRASHNKKLPMSPWTTIRVFTEKELAAGESNGN